MDPTPLWVTGCAVLLAACAGPAVAPHPTQYEEETFELDSFRWRGDISGSRLVTATNAWGDLRTRTSDRGTEDLIVSAMIQKIGTKRDEFEIRIEPATEAVAVTVVPIVAEPRGRVDLTLLIPPGRRLEGTTLDGLAELKYKGDVAARTRGGRIVVRTPAHAQASSESGDIIAQLSAGGWRDPVSLTSDSGGVTVLLPADSNLVLRASSPGTIELDFPPRATADVLREGERLEATLGAGGSELRVRSGFGPLRILPLAGRSPAGHNAADA